MTRFRETKHYYVDAHGEMPIHEGDVFSCDDGIYSVVRWGTSGWVVYCYEGRWDFATQNWIIGELLDTYTLDEWLFFKQGEYRHIGNHP